MRYYAGLIRATPLEEIRDGLLGGIGSACAALPVGVVGAIVPWNFPAVARRSSSSPPRWRRAARSSSSRRPETVLDALLLAEAVAEAGLPPGVLNIVPGGREIGAYLVDHPGIDKVAFTGSTDGRPRDRARPAGGCCARSRLELGGKSAAIILDDADLDLRACEQFFAATLLNNGQTCFLGTRVLAPASRYDEIVDDRERPASAALNVGDALDPSHADRADGLGATPRTASRATSRRARRGRG